ncbi:MAG: hypothetical protein CVU65_07000 [Deltaproteobacteria bacterium HGW-Deltaproteobacteria-22]|nr:MAG: hypothetical protein CVU65_07000 [Deltaproteobacteria bacterium HGW-Deltaproteobacteria-22]
MGWWHHGIVPAIPVQTPALFGRLLNSCLFPTEFHHFFTRSAVASFATFSIVFKCLGKVGPDHDALFKKHSKSIAGQELVLMGFVLADLSATLRIRLCKRHSKTTVRIGFAAADGPCEQKDDHGVNQR